MKSLNKIYLLFTVALLSYGVGLSQTTVPSIISSNQTWTASGSPYIVNANTLINTGVTVNVEPGVIIRSTADRLKIIIDGTFKAIGTKDSVIVADSITFEFTAKCTDYDPATGNGSQFHYVLFRNPAYGGTQTINLKSKSMLVKNCKFLNGYYNIYAYVAPYDTTDLIIEKTIFKGEGSKQGYMVYNSGTTRLQITDCYAENIGGISVGKWTTIKNSTFKNFGYSGGLRQSAGNELILECNVFKNFRYTILDLTYPGTNAHITVKENTFDSCDVLLKLRGGAMYRPVKFEMKKNNFLHYNVNTVQVSVGANPGQADTFDMTQNYWGTSTKADIETGIKDFSDDITLEGYIDFSGYLTSPVTTCTNGGNIGGSDTSASTSSITKILDNGLTMYPNPADGQVKIESDGRIIKTIKVVDLQGKVHVDKSISNTLGHIDLHQLVSGIYIIEVSGDGFNSRNKLIVKH